nr:laccase-14-like [Ipomoea batatas]
MKRFTALGPCVHGPPIKATIRAPSVHGPPIKATIRAPAPAIQALSKPEATVKASRVMSRTALLPAFECVMKKISLTTNPNMKQQMNDGRNLRRKMGGRFITSWIANLILDTFRITVEYGKMYLLRMVNAVMNNILFFSIANYHITVVGSNSSYIKSFKSDYITLSPIRHTIDFLLEANKPLNHYYMAAKAYSSTPTASFDTTTTIAVVEYSRNYTPSPSPPMPNLPNFYDTNSMNVPIHIFQAYYKHINRVYRKQFLNFPPLSFNFTANTLAVELQLFQGMEVKVLEYGSVVELVFQGTNLLSGINHPMRLHGYRFYVVGWGFGNFDKDKDPLN